MAIRYLRSFTNFSAGATSIGNTTPFAPNLGCLLIVFSGTADAAATLSIADTQTHTWTLISGPSTTATDVTYSWYTFSTSPLPTTITVTKSGGSQFMNIMIDEFQGVAKAGTINVSSPATGSGTPTVNITPTIDNTMLWSGCNDTITNSGASYTRAANDTQSDGTEYLALGYGTANVAQTVNWVGSGTWNMVAVALTPAPSPPRLNRLRPYIFGPGLAR